MKKAVGFDWLKKKIATLRHSTGSSKFTGVKSEKEEQDKAQKVAELEQKKALKVALHSAELEQKKALKVADLEQDEKIRHFTAKKLYTFEDLKWDN